MARSRKHKEGAGGSRGRNGYVCETFQHVRWWKGDRRSPFDGVSVDGIMEGMI